MSKLILANGKNTPPFDRDCGALSMAKVNECQDQEKVFRFALPSTRPQTVIW